MGVSVGSLWFLQVERRQLESGYRQEEGLGCGRSGFARSVGGSTPNSGV